MAEPVTRQLTRPRWQAACRALLAKLLAEFSYEELLHPEPVPDGYRLALPEGPEYRFTARRGAYGSWQVDPGSIRADGQPAADPFAFVLAARGLLGLSGDTSGHLVRELTATLLADVRLAAGALSAAELADLDHTALEGHQSGHPWLVLNKGRLGFSATDAAAWTPEARTPARLNWLAVHRDLAEYRGTGALAEAEVLHRAELDAEVLAGYRRRLADQGLDPAAYLLLPVHPWQWDETVLPLFAPWVAEGRIVLLPPDGDLRLPQQSIRSFFNVTSPHRHTVKLPLSVLNTLVWRGLPTERTLAAPAVTAWIHGLRDRDPFLREECRVVLLGEVASVTVEHPYYARLPEAPYQYKELLGAIWREPLGAYLAPGERGRTLAALLQTGADGRSLAEELIARSGLTARAWAARLLGVMLPPLLHFLYRYGTVFSPHGENAILLFDSADVPVRLAVKDFVDDVNLSDQDLPELRELPPAVARVLLREPPAGLCQFLHAGLFIGVYRYLAPLLERRAGLPEAEFWGLLRAEVLAYQERFPELAERFALFDLLTPTIDRLCLNRNRLLLDGYRDRAERPHAAVHGQVPNPLAAAPRAGEAPEHPGPREGFVSGAP
ncbi:IucA/IucC family siderophore biosynthesis protein [Kitasatospora sp. NBC_01287]|uniref:IucA/IucC family protein n=1 Tax=Kitasatospora sp. NBC_01287 TaxID=2903573 RepID=UPI0022550994|nr:IucA/IucC family siderophore biosynthesis protein [Kitasatospora sp. NBC_01287]MCX4746499.1 IucA/IucC family siderophore biosynthesis protein [Kitasatospora sp. NBC_01287]